MSGRNALRKIQGHNNSINPACCRMAGVPELVLVAVVVWCAWWSECVPVAWIAWICVVMVVEFLIIVAENSPLGVEIGIIINYSRRIHAVSQHNP